MMPSESAFIDWTAIYGYILIVVVIAGWMVADLFAQHRKWHRDIAAAAVAKIERKRGFLISVRGWRSEIANFQKMMPWPMKPGDKNAAIVQAYCTTKLRQFHAAFVKSQSDFADDRKCSFQLTHHFHQIVTLCCQEFDFKTDPRAAVLEEIDAMITFLEQQRILQATHIAGSYVSSP